MNMNLRLLASAATLALAACGGGGSSAGGSFALADLQGFWDGPVAGADFGGAAKARSVVLDDGRTWVFLHDAADALVGLAHGQLALAGDTASGSGARYDAAGAKVKTVSLSGQPAADKLSLSSTDAGAGTPSTMALVEDNRYYTPAVAADAVGTWSFSQAGGTIQHNWRIDSAGVLDGFNNDCTYRGTVKPRAGTAVYEVVATETCSGGTKQLSGIAKFNTDKTWLTFGLTTPDASAGMAFAARQALG